MEKPYEKVIRTEEMGSIENVWKWSFEFVYSFGLKFLIPGFPGLKTILSWNMLNIVG